MSRNARVYLLAAILVLMAVVASATTFVMPTDEEMVAKANAIAVGTVEGSYVQKGVNGVETIYEIRVDRELKGTLRSGELLRVSSPGGVYGELEVVVPGAARYEQGERVVVFLTLHNGRWTTTDLMLGKFRSVTSSRGARLLARDSDDVEIRARAEAPAEERLRTEDGFVRFIENAVAGRPRTQDYFVAGSTVSLSTSSNSFKPRSNIAPYANKTYTQMGATALGVRWDPAVIGVGLSYLRRTSCLGNNGGVRTCDIGGAPDTLINNALAAWTNECASAVVLNNGGTTLTAARTGVVACGGFCDFVNIMEFNDPNDLISGSWVGSGTIAVAYIVFNTISTPNVGADYREIFDGDITFQDGYLAAEAAFPTALTHEAGHTIGKRHSNANPANPNGATTNPATNCSAATEDCDPSPGAAIMYWQAISAFGNNLQTWDRNAVQAVYPGGACNKRRGDFGADRKSDILWRSSAGANLLWTMNGTAVVSGAYTPSVDPGWTLAVSGDFNGDGKTDLVWRETATGRHDVWTMNGAAFVSDVVYDAFPPGWSMAATGDADADGDDDILWRNTSTGANLLWYMNAGAVLSGAYVPTVDTGWTLQQTGDFNGNRKMDLIWRENATGRIDIWIMNGHLYVSDTVYAAFPPDWFIQATGDSNNDGNDDIVWRNNATGANLLWRMNGSSILLGQYYPSVDPSWTLAAWGDFNNDNNLDLVWRETGTGRIDIWQMNVNLFASDSVYSGYAPGVWNLVSPK